MSTKAEYKPITGFYDLRAFNIPEATFVKLWGIQELLKDVDTYKRKGWVHPRLEEVKEQKADYVKTLSQYQVKNRI